jgi:hypothetical protein
MSWRRIAAAVAGPLLIVGLVVFALHGFVFGASLTNEHPDLLSFWLPRWTFLGRAVADGTIPVWNPYEMLGYRFAADPQSGWLYVPPMVLFSTLAPAAAMRAMVVLNPALAGLAMYGFLRLDGLGRVAATAGGLSLAGVMAGSEIAIAMPFAGAMAWSAVLLLGAAGYRRAGRWRGRLGWLALAGFAWSQVASAHLSHGLVVGTVLATAYLAANAWGHGGAAWGRLAVFVLALPVLSLAVLVPRIAFIEDSSLGQGYDRLGRGVPGVEEEPPIMPGGVWATWPLAFAAVPGAAIGAAGLLAVPLALRARRRRRLVAAFAGALAATWVLLLPIVLGTGWVRTAIGALPYGDVLLHNPGRLRYVAVLALPVLAAAGIQGASDEPLPARRLAGWLAAGVGLWLVVPLGLGAHPGHWLAFAVGAVAAGTVWLVAAGERRWAPAIVAVLVAELVVGISIGHAWTGDEVRLGLEGSRGTPLHLQPLRRPDVDLDAYLAPTPFVEAIGEDRYLTWVPPDAAYEKGYLFAQDPPDWPAMANERGTLFQIRDVLGYNPVQLPRYWAWIRAANPLPVTYNAAVLARPRTADVRLAGVRYLIVPQSVAPTVDGTVVATADGYDLVEVDDAAAFVELRGSWEVVGSPGEAIEGVTRDGFDEAVTMVLEAEPRVRRSSGTPGGVRWSFPSRSEIRIDVGAVRQGVLLVRTAYDPGWRARIDDAPARVLAADGFLTAVAVPTGGHAVVLRYEDPWVLRGLLLSAAAWGLLALAWLVAFAGAARRTPADEAPLR